MKKLYTLTFITAIMLAGMSLTAQVDYYIKVLGPGGGCTFDPDTIGITLLDSIYFVHAAGTFTHNSGSTPTLGAAPPAADTWYCQTLNAMNDTCGPIWFTVEQEYTYSCTLHGGIGTGSIFVSPTGIDNPQDGHKSVSYPNPFSNTTIIKFKGIEVDQLQVFDLVGRQVLTRSVSKSSNMVALDMGDLPNGAYFYRLMEEGQVVETKKLVKHN